MKATWVVVILLAGALLAYALRLGHPGVEAAEGTMSGPPHAVLASDALGASGGAPPPTSPESGSTSAEREAFARTLSKRFAPWAAHTASSVLAVLPPEFCTLYPSECAAMRARPEATLGELFGAPPDAAALASYLDDPTVRLPWNDCARLNELSEALLDLFGRQAQLPPFIGASARASDRPGAETIEARIHSVLWKTRCERENAMLRGLKQRDAFWWHTSRVLRRHASDDSSWFPHDEMIAWRGDEPLYLDL